MGVDGLDSDAKDYNKKMTQYNKVLSYFQNTNPKIEGENGSLKNGDELKLTFDVSKEKQKDLGISLKNQSFKVKAEDLKEVTVTDPFAALKISYTGVNGYGAAELEMTPLPNIENPIFRILDSTIGLSNGDRLKVAFEYEKTSSELEGYIYEPLQKEFIVSGLEEAKTVDPFEALKVSFEGKDGYGHIKLEVSELKGLSNPLFRAEESETLKNGDKVTVQFRNEKDEAIAEGVIFEPAEKEYTVSGLETLEEISAETLKAGYELKFLNAAPVLEVSINNKLDKELKPYISYELTQNDNKIGGDIIVKAVCSDERELAEAGYKLPDDDLDFVTKIGEGNTPLYITDVSQLDKETREQLVSQLKDLTIAMSSSDRWWNQSDHGYIKNVKYLNVKDLILLTVKPGMESTIDKNFNMLYAVMNVQATLTSIAGGADNGEVNDLYMTAYGTDFILNPDGTNSFDIRSMAALKGVYNYEGLIKENINVYADTYNITYLTPKEFLADAGGEKETEKTEPSKTEPAKTEPSKTEPAKTEPSKTEPAKTEPAKTEPAKTEPAKTEPAETKSSETKSAETKSSETKPSETKPSETSKKS